MATQWYVTRKPSKEYVLYDFARSAKQAKDMIESFEGSNPIAHKSKSQGGLYNLYVKKGSPLWREKGGKAGTDDDIKFFEFEEHTDITVNIDGKDEKDFFKKGEAISGKIEEEVNGLYTVSTDRGRTYYIPKDSVKLVSSFEKGGETDSFKDGIVVSYDEIVDSEGEKFTPTIKYNSSSKEFSADFGEHSDYYKKIEYAKTDMEKAGFKNGKDSSTATHVVVSETKDGYWVTMSKATDKAGADKLSKATTPVKGEVLKVVTVDELASHKKVLLEKGGEIKETSTQFKKRSEKDSVRIYNAWKKVLDSDFGDKEYQRFEKLVKDTQIPSDSVNKIQDYTTKTPREQHRTIDVYHYWGKDTYAKGGEVDSFSHPNSRKMRNILMMNLPNKFDVRDVNVRDNEVIVNLNSTPHDIQYVKNNIEEEVKKLLAKEKLSHYKISIIMGYAKGGEIKVRTGNAHRDDIDELTEYLDDNSWSYKREEDVDSNMPKVLIDTKNVSREEIEELNEYLEDNSWNTWDLKNKGGTAWSDWKNLSFDKIKQLSKDNPKETFYVTDSNNSNIGQFWLRNGKFAKMTTANPSYDFQSNKTSLRKKSDVIYKFKKATVSYAKGGGVSFGWAKKYVEDENTYKKLDWYIMMGKGEEKTINKIDYVFFKDGSALKYNEEVSEWEFTLPKRFDEKNGEGIYAKGGSVKKKGWFTGALSFLNW